MGEVDGPRLTDGFGPLAYGAEVKHGMNVDPWAEILYQMKLRTRWLTDLAISCMNRYCRDAGMRLCGLAD